VRFPAGGETNQAFTSARKLRRNQRRAEMERARISRKANRCQVEPVARHDSATGRTLHIRVVRAIIRRTEDRRPNKRKLTPPDFRRKLVTREA